MTEHRGPDAKKVYSFRFSPNDLIHWRLAAESHGLTLTDWMERSCNTGVYDFAMALIDAGTYPGRRSKLMGLQAQLLIDARRKEDGDAGPPSSDPQERLRPDRDVRVDRRSTGKRERRARSKHDPGLDVAAGVAASATVEVSSTPDNPRSSESPSGLPEARDVDDENLDPTERAALEFLREDMAKEESLSTPGPAPKSPEPELAKQMLAKRGCCVHGTQRGWRCWRCGGKAKIAGDPETMSKREQAKAEREKAKASKKKGKGRR